MATKLAPGQMQEVLETFMYEPEVFLVDEVTKLDYARREIEAMMDTRRDLPFARHQAKPSRRLVHRLRGYRAKHVPEPVTDDS